MKKLLVGSLLSLMASVAMAEMAVIVHPSNANAIDKDTIQRIFLGKTRAFPDGKEALPISMKEGSAEYNSFAETVLSKSDKQLKAYWAKVIFTGQGTPPREVDSAAQMLDLVANNPNLIGFVPAGSVSGAVKVVGKF
ncbi:MAG: hypothetical protein RL217_2055 [Pseudomonadota bacterium]|jgi:ABC-type phosphate transport system substrate-binding protein